MARINGTVIAFLSAIGSGWSPAAVATLSTVAPTSDESTSTTIDRSTLAPVANAPTVHRTVSTGAAAQPGEPETKRAKLTAEQAAEIRARLGAGATQATLRREYGLSAGSMSMLAGGKTYRGDNGRVGWRAVCATLAFAGPRISETIDLRERDVRLHDPAGSRLWIPDSKTPTGVRHVEITPALRDELLAHLAEKIRRGYPTGPDNFVFCTRDGHRWSESNVRNRVLAPAATRASARLVDRGLPPLPHVTPHTLRRTYVSIMLLATNFDVPSPEPGRSRR